MTNDTTTRPQTVVVERYVSALERDLAGARMHLLREWITDHSGLNHTIPSYIVETLGQVASVERRLDYLRHFFGDHIDEGQSNALDVELAEMLDQLGVAR